MLYKVCPTCKEKYEHISKDSKCSNGCMNKAKSERNSNYDKFSRNKESTAFYATGRWKKLTKICRNKFVGLDIYAYYIHNQMVGGSLSHHVIEIAEDKDKAYRLDNLVWLSDSSHKEVHVAYKNGERKEMQKILNDLIKRYEKDFG